MKGRPLEGGSPKLQLLWCENAYCVTGSAGLTVVRPAGVEHMMCVRSEADIQHAPAHITRLHCPPQVKASPGGVVQADVLVCGMQQQKK